MAHRAHVHWAVVVKAKARDGDLVGEILHGLNLRVVYQVADHMQRQVIHLRGDINKFLSQPHQPLLNRYFFRRFHGAKIHNNYHTAGKKPRFRVSLTANDGQCGTDSPIPYG